MPNSERGTATDRAVANCKMSCGCFRSPVGGAIGGHVPVCGFLARTFQPRRARGHQVEMSHRVADSCSPTTRSVHHVGYIACCLWVEILSCNRQ